MLFPRKPDLKVCVVVWACLLVSVVVGTGILLALRAEWAAVGILPLGGGMFRATIHRVLLPETRRPSSSRRIVKRGTSRAARRSSTVKSRQVKNDPEKASR